MGMKRGMKRATKQRVKSLRNDKRACPVKIWTAGALPS